MEQAERIAGNLALIIFLVIALSASYHLDFLNLGPDDVTTAKNVAADVAAAQAAAVQVAQVK